MWCCPRTRYIFRGCPGEMRGKLLKRCICCMGSSGITQTGYTAQGSRGEHRIRTLFWIPTVNSPPCWNTITSAIPLRSAPAPMSGISGIPILNGPWNGFRWKERKKAEAAEIITTLQQNGRLLYYKNKHMF